MAELEQIIPRPGEVRPDKPYRTPDRRWEEVTEDMYGSTDLPTNIYIEHDPFWDQRLFSVQNAGDQAKSMMVWLPKTETSRPNVFGFWTIICLLFIAADLGWIVVRML